MPEIHSALGCFSHGFPVQMLIGPEMPILGLDPAIHEPLNSAQATRATKQAIDALMEQAGIRLDNPALASILEYADAAKALQAIVADRENATLQPTFDALNRWYHADDAVRRDLHGNEW